LEFGKSVYNSKNLYCLMVLEFKVVIARVVFISPITY
jgi:hypothetical protein